MARMGRVVAPGLPHHVTQRGNRRMQTFFADEDYRYYLALASEWCARFDVSVWAYCLMPNHVHLVLAPESLEGLHRAVSEVHRRYTRHVDFRQGWRGHLWQGRFASFVMDEPYPLRIPAQTDHRFQLTRIIDSGGKRSLIPKVPIRDTGVRLLSFVGRGR